METGTWKADFAFIMALKQSGTNCLTIYTRVDKINSDTVHFIELVITLTPWCTEYKKI